MISLHAHFTENEMKALRRVADQRRTERDEPVSVSSTARHIVKAFLSSQTGLVGNPHGGIFHDEQQSS